MKARLCVIPFLFAFFVVESSYAQHQIYYLPQVANGSYGAGSYRTTFILFNNGNSAAAVTLTLTDDNGNPLAVRIPEYGTSSQFTFNLTPGAIQIFQTDGLGSVSVGAATVTSTAAIGVSAIFTLYDGAGHFMTESGVSSSQLLTDFTLPVDITGNFDTAVALFNPGNSQVNIVLRLLDTAGHVVGSNNSISLQPQKHTAAYISQYFAKSNFRGTLAVSAPGGVVPLTLRQNSAPLSFTTLPVVTGSCTQGPMTITTAATSISTSGGTINGTVNPNGQSTSVWFEWGTTTSLGHSTGKGTATGTTASSWYFALSGLTSNTTYYFRIVAQSDAGTSYGSILSFTTGSTGQTNPFLGHSLQVNGTVTLEGHAVQTKFYSDFSFQDSPLAMADSSLDPTSLVAFGILFDKPVTYNGNTVTFATVSSGSSYMNFYRSMIVHTIISGSITITLTSTTVGSTVSGQLSFKLDDGTSLQSNFSGTLVSYN